MNLSFPSTAFKLTLIATTGERFADFGPYVASVNYDGVVAFAASLTNGGSGAYLGDGESIHTIVESATSPLAEICSHLDINSDGTVCFYAKLKTGGSGVFVVQDGRIT